MNDADDFRAALVSYAPLTALVPAERISQNAADQSAEPPYIVFTAREVRSHGLANNLQATSYAVQVQCWGVSAAQADDVADEVEAALGVAFVICGTRTTAFDPQLDLDATVLTVDW